MTRMRRIFLIALAAVLPGLTNGISADSFSDGRLLDKTLRINYIFTGSDKDCDIAVAELLSAHGWYGRRTNLKEVPLRGNGQLTMTDKARATLFTGCRSALCSRNGRLPRRPRGPQEFRERVPCADAGGPGGDHRATL